MDGVNHIIFRRRNTKKVLDLKELTRRMLG